MIFPPVGRAAEVVNDSVIFTSVLCATRSTADIAKDTADGAKAAVGGAPMPPEGTPTDGAVSTSVCTVIPTSLPAVTAPIVRPPRVMKKAVAGAMPIPPIVMMIFVGEGKDDVIIMPATDACIPKGVPFVAKKPEG